MEYLSICMTDYNSEQTTSIYPVLQLQINTIHACDENYESLK